MSKNLKTFNKKRRIGFTTIYETPKLYTVTPKRLAVCEQCGRKTGSNPNLPFFKFRADMLRDTYYCGCYGWD